jgi:hypothetical protein
MVTDTSRTSQKPTVQPNPETSTEGIAVPNSEGKTPADGQAYNEAVLKDAKIRDLENQLSELQRETIDGKTTKLTAEGGTKVSVPSDQAKGLKALGFK